MTNIERLRDQINASGCAKEIMAFLSAFATEPVAQKPDDVRKKCEIVIGEILAIANEPQIDQEAS